MKQNVLDFHRIIAVLITTAIICAFFLPLFYPEPKLFATPDFGQSDIWNLNLPAKQFLSESLKRGEWPLWNKYVGGGYPQLAEGQIGTFYIPNLLLFRFLPFVEAFNIGYIVTFVIASWGMHWFLRLLGRSVLASFFGSLLFTFSGIFATHLTHYNLIQSISLVPWIFAAQYKIANSGKVYWGVLLSFLISQQIFTGFPQITLITILGLLTSIFFFSKQKTTKNYIKIYIVSMLFISLGFVASSIQLLPQSEFLNASTRQGGLDAFHATLFSFPFIHLLTMIDPYALGDPRRGTYSPDLTIQNSIFWENTGYIGIVPLIFILLSLFQKKKTKKYFFFLFLSLGSILLMTGKFSPLYFIFTFPPLSFFRVPSRFIVLFVFSLTILSAFGFDFVKNRYRSLKFILLCLTFLAMLQLFYFAKDYNTTLPAKLILKKPQTAEFLEKNSTGKILSWGSAFHWNKIFFDEGWKNPEKYIAFNNSLLANQNSLWQIESLNVYQSQITRRYEVISTLFQDMQSSQNKNIATPSSVMIKMLRLYNTDTITTPFILSHEELSQIYKTQKEPIFRIYKLQNVKPQFYFTNKIKSIKTLKEFIENIKDDDVVYIEKNLDFPRSAQTPSSNISLIKNDNLNKVFNLKTTTPGLLVINSSFDKGWNATIDGKQTNVIPANLNQIAVPIKNKGSFNIKLEYTPQSFQVGKYFTLFIYIFFALLSLLILAKRQRRKLP